jgi:sulfur relay (sulfurtransferase) complex TusBCD TusD component (DsrE family)
MRRGCISLGNVVCDQCQRLIKYPEKYLYFEENGKTVVLCMECCRNRGLLKREESSKKSETLFDLSEK